MTIEWVEITHPDLDAPPARVTRQAFEEVWKAKGFVLVEAPKKTTKKKETE